jgi:hypothetical protein
VVLVPFKKRFWFLFPKSDLILGERVEGGLMMWEVFAIVHMVIYNVLNLILKFTIDSP